MNTIPLTNYLSNPKVYGPETIKMIQDLQEHRKFVTSYYPNAVQTVTHKKGEGWYVCIVDCKFARDKRGLAVIDTRNAPAPQLLSETYCYSNECFDTMHAPAAWANAALRIAKLIA